MNFRTAQRREALLSGLLLLLAVTLSMPALSATRFVDATWVDLNKTPESLTPGVSAFPSITEALATAVDGDRILVCPGRYDETVERFPIVVDRSVVIRSTDGPERTVVAGPLATDAFEIVAPGTEISGLTIEHARSGVVVSADDVSIAKNRILLSALDYRTSSCGVWIAGVRRARVVDNEFVGCGVCLVGPRVSAETGTRTALTGLFEVGEDPEWFTTHVIEENVVNGRPLVYAVDLTRVEIAEDAGQILLVGCTDVTVRGARIAEASVGVEIAHSTGIDLLACELRDNGLFGVYLAYSNDCCISDVICIGNNHGVDLRSSHRNELIGGLVQGNEQGIFSAAGLANAVSASTITENGIGVYLGNSTWNTLFDNEITRNRLGVYTREAEGTWIVDNLVVGNELSGIRLSKASDWSVVERNAVAENGNGILVLDSDHAIVQRNEVKGSEITGVYLSGAALTSVCSNLFLGNSLDIRIEQRTRDTTIHTNAFLGDGPAIRNEGTEPVNARNNWWGTTDEPSIARRVLGPVHFLPLLDVPPEFSEGIGGGF